MPKSALKKTGGIEEIKCFWKNDRIGVAHIIGGAPKKNFSQILTYTALCGETATQKQKDDSSQFGRTFGTASDANYAGVEVCLRCIINFSANEEY